MAPDRTSHVSPPPPLDRSAWRTRIRRALAGATAAVALAAVAILPTAATGHAATPVPPTVPALQQWTGTSGGFVLTPAVRVLADSTYAGTLTDDAQQFAADLSVHTGTTVPVVKTTPDQARTGDIVLTLGSADTQLGTEGYALKVAGALTVTARTDAGAFYGTRTVLQLLGRSNIVPGGTARDWPAKPERGLMVDVGRKYFTIGWLQQQIREMAHLKLNYLHLHLSDDKGFRIESTSHPEVVSTQHYSKQEMTDLIAYAARYHVMVVPEIDAPGHMAPILAAHPDLQLKDSSGTAATGKIDLSLPGAYTIVDDLVKEYLALFPAPYFHMGADEYLTSYTSYPQLLTYAQAHYGSGAKAADTYYGFINHVDSVIRAAGKTARMWTDGIHGDGTVTPNADIIGEKWNSAGLSAQALVDAGHIVTNEPRSQLYYVLGGYKPPTASLYTTWTADTFDNGGTLTDPTKNRGSKLHIWCDTPGAETEEQVADGIAKPLRVLAQQTWGSPKPTAAYLDFVPVMGAAGHSTGHPSAALPGNLAQYRPVTTSSVEPVLRANMNGAGNSTNNTDYFAGANVTDDAATTRWSSLRADPQWLQVDLGASQSIGRVKLAWEAAYGKAYQVQMSQDGTTWTTIYSTSTGNGDTDDLTGLSGQGRYLRLTLTQRGTTYGYSLYGVEVYSPDLAQARPTTASSVETADFPSEYATDGDPATRWSSLRADPQWLQVDLGASQSIGRVKLAWEAAYGKAYQVQMSQDGTTWTTIYSTSTGNGDTDDLTGLSGQGRYLRLTLTQRGTTYGYSLYSVQVYS
ncbi:family 20 glycosylhydrolase [Streptomyces sp. NPDC005706]|uniref:family 20 glycosylhydrolase n=1 Tax=Streptomyces sp. NPDC005706 TaxID=3157169 RepID=UPI0033E2CE4B